MRHLSLYILLLMCHSFVAQTYIVYKGDTINRTDQRNHKQGLWILFDDDSQKVVEEGQFINNQKVGIWKGFHTNGRIKHKITFRNNIASGPATFYYENGKISESGMWQNDHWIGNYKYYYESGQIAYDWKYNTSGKRAGEQKYYHKNGKLKYKGNWQNGKNDGPLNIYNEQGKMTAQRIYKDGKFAETNAQDPPNQITEPETKIQKELSKFRETGKRIIFNDQGRIGQNGYFIDGSLYNGEEYKYNAKGLLILKIIYENGQQVDSIRIKR